MIVIGHQRHRLNPNLAVYEQQALKVACPFCRAPVGQPCWVLRSRRNGHEGFNTTYLPHKARVKLSWKEQR